MVVSYSKDIANIGLSTGLRLLCKWHGSIFKVLWKEAVIYFLLYAFFSLLYRFGLTGYSAEVFESFVMMCKKYMTVIPTTFILGFYVSIVFGRWNIYLNNLPFLDHVSELLCLIPGKDAKSLLYRQHIIRYCLAGQVLLLRNVSLQIRKRFPTMDHLVNAGLLREPELVMVESVQKIAENDTKFWLPLHWAICLFTRARLDSLIAGDNLLYSCIQPALAATVAKEKKVLDMRKQCETLLVYDMINIPLVYTQIVSIAVWGYFAAALFGSQWLDYTKETVDEPKIDMYLPLFTMIQFVCMVGWLRVAQNMLNPLGEKDDDFELNWLLDRNFMVGTLLSDEVHMSFPPLLSTSLSPNNLMPHTVASADAIPDEPMTPSCFDIEVPESGHTTVANSRAVSRATSRRNSLAYASNRRKGSLAVLAARIRELANARGRPGSRKSSVAVPLSPALSINPTTPSRPPSPTLDTLHEQEEGEYGESEGSKSDIVVLGSPKLIVHSSPNPNSDQEC